MNQSKSIVIKYGGSILKDDTLKEQLIKDIIAVKNKGFCPIIVHGGGSEINASLKKLGNKVKFINGLRVTDKNTMEVVEMVLSGKVNKNIVSFINKNRGCAVGLSGKDGNLIVAKKKKSKVNLGFVGEVSKVNPQIINSIKEEYIPVVSSVASDTKGITYNINADEVAAGIAGAIKADRLILLTDVNGVLKNESDPDSCIPVIKISDIAKLIKTNVIKTGMIPKLKSCVNAIKSGVREVDIVKGTQKHVLLKLIQTHKIGTKIIK